MDHSLYHQTPHFLPFRRKHRKSEAHSSHSRSSDKSAPPSSPPAASSSAPRVPSRPPPPPPLLYNEDFYAYLDKGVKALQEDYTSGAREMANQALKYLATTIELAAITARDAREMWELAVRGGKALAGARPAMRNPFLSHEELQQQQQKALDADTVMISAAITACLLRALSSIRERWDVQPQGGQTDPSKLAGLSSQVIQKIVKQRRDADKALGRSFAFWIKKLVVELNPPVREPHANPAPITLHILTLSNSSTIRTAVLALLGHAPDLHVHLTIMESRPRFEGADMAARILDEAKKMEALDRVRVRLIPDCAVGTAVLSGQGWKNVDVVLLGADRISAEGEVSNKIGSLAAVVCAKTLGGEAVKVVVVSDGDKIVGDAALAEGGHGERHPAEELMGGWKGETREAVEGMLGASVGGGLGEEEKGKGREREGGGEGLDIGRGLVEVWGEWFEVVHSHFVDAYVTEQGIWGKEDVRRAGEEVRALEEKVFGRRG